MVLVVEFFVGIFVFFFIIYYIFKSAGLGNLLQTEEGRLNKAVERYGDEFMDRFRETSLPILKQIGKKYWYQMGDEYVAGLAKPYQEMYEMMKECPALLKQSCADHFVPLQYKLVTMVKDGLVPLEYLVGGVDLLYKYLPVVNVVPLRTDEKVRGLDPIYYGHNKIIATKFEAQKEIMMWVNRQFEARGDPGRMVACFTTRDPVRKKCLPAELVEYNDYGAFWAFYPSQPIGYSMAKSFNEIRILCDLDRAKNAPPRYKTYGKF